MDKHSSHKFDIDQLISVDFSKNEQLKKSLFLRFRRERLPLRLAATMLATIKAAPEKFDVVLGLQQVLIYKIGECDLRIARLNKAQKRIPRILARPEFRVGGAAIKARSTNLKRLREGIMDRIKEVRHLAYLWRCFGDGIAAVYQSQHALRHLMYDNDYKIKATAGALFGKEGFGHEYAILEKGIAMGVPVVMSDLTNIIRHGDVCALAGPDPYPIELKLSPLTGGRVARQAEQLQMIKDFFDNDEAANFRGQKRVARLEVVTEEVHHRDMLNNGICRALNEGFWSESPEPGLRYICYHTALKESPERVAKALDDWWLPAAWMTPLSPNLDWLPGYPFTLSMAPENAVMFMQESVSVIVLIDLEFIKKLFSDLGVHCVWIMDGTHAGQIFLDPNDLLKGAWRFSQCLFQRVSTEFLSLVGFVAERAELLRVKEMSAREFSAVDKDEIILTPPSEWMEVRDFYRSD